MYIYIYIYIYKLYLPTAEDMNEDEFWLEAFDTRITRMATKRVDGPPGWAKNVPHSSASQTARHAPLSAHGGRHEQMHVYSGVHKGFLTHVVKLSWTRFPLKLLDIIIPSRWSNFGAVNPFNIMI